MIENRAASSAFLVGVIKKPPEEDWGSAESLSELARLARTAGLKEAGRTAQRLPHPDPATYLGEGKLEEVREAVAAYAARFVIVDDELSGGQLRALEEAFGEGVRVIDRTALILDIFARHARTREGQIQVELAQLEYRLPRLTRMWTHLVRQAGGHAAGAIGGVGLRGPGETQLETDRRVIRRRIARLRRELEGVRRHRRQNIGRRRRTGLMGVCLVGYTNAGKTSMLNALQAFAGPVNHEPLPAADSLFSTLDPTTRRIRLPGGLPALVTDTVGFIHKLPHHLVAAFRATLEGILEADLLVQVCDASHPQAAVQNRIVDRVLADLGAEDRPRIAAWNKVDLLDGQARLFPGKDALGVSALNGEGIGLLLERIEAILTRDLIPIQVELPYTAKGRDLLHRVYELGAVTAQNHGEDGTRVHARVPAALARSLKAYTSRMAG